VGNDFVYIQDEKSNLIEYNSVKLSKAAPTKALYVENNNLILIENNKSRILNPLGKGVYVWESLSKNENKILFTFGNQGTFICDLEGNILNHIDAAHFPRFSPNGKFVSYMIDKDNGHSYVESDLYIYSISEDRSHKITDTKERIEMYAEWSPGGNRLIYHDTNGKLYITSLEFEN
jgi:hypothetical protein